MMWYGITFKNYYHQIIRNSHSCFYSCSFLSFSLFCYLSILFNQIPDIKLCNANHRIVVCTNRAHFIISSSWFNELHWYRFTVRQLIATEKKLIWFLFLASNANIRNTPQIVWFQCETKTIPLKLAHKFIERCAFINKFALDQSKKENNSQKYRTQEKKNNNICHIVTHRNEQ